MTVSTVSSNTPTVNGADGTQFSTGTDRTALDTNTFLKLLVAQLQYQDPTNPTDTTAFMQQTAQLSSVERLQELVASQQAMVTAAQSQSAMSVVGRLVTYTDVSGVSHTGLATACTVGAGVPRITVDGLEIEFSAVTKVSSASTSTTGGATTDAGTSTSTGSGGGTTAT